MWKLMKKDQLTYFIYCNFNTNKQEVTFILYDLKDTWSQTLTITDVKQKVKLLNKRFDFSEDNIKEALTSDAPQFVAIEEQPQTSALQQLDSCLLKLKYRVKNCILNYEWILRKQTIREFQKTFVHPLLMALLGCQEQIEILSESIRKKDIELNQYRIEGAVLNRKTVATKPFNFDDLKKNYEDCNKVAINFKELAKYVKEADLKEIPDILNKQMKINKMPEDNEPEEKSNAASNTNTKMSPRQKKRKVKEIKMQHLEEHLKRRKQGLEYESSQSQTPSSCNSQTTDETEVKDTKKQETINSIKQTPKANILSPRKSARCTSTTQKQEYISSEDKTDSESDGNQRILRDRRTTSSSLNQSQTTNTKSSKEETTKKSENIKNEKTVQNCAKSLNLSYKCQITSPEKSSESSNIFDFSTDTEDDKSLKGKKKLQIKKREKSNLTKSENLNRYPKAKDIHQISDTDDDVLLVEGANKSLQTNGSARHDSNDVLSQNSIVVNSIKLNSLISMNTSSPKRKNLSHSPAPVVIEDLSSQLNNIKKELECLEAMRLADLKQRMCKA